MEIDQLRYFLKVAQRQNFTLRKRRPSDQSAGVEPGHRKTGSRNRAAGFRAQTRKVLLTDAGRLLLARAEQILALVEDTLAEITDDGESGHVRVGAIPTVAPYFLPGILSRFSRQVSAGQCAGV